MTISFYRSGSAAMIAALFMLSACDTIDTAKTPAATGQASASSSAPAAVVAAPQPPPAPAALTDGIALYNKGSYSAAIKRLANGQEIWSADTSFQTEALKYMAFSYCVTSRRKLCKQQFEKALRLDPAFDLAPGEQGHPLWGPVFNQAKRSVAASAKK
ncbi:TssQ family T6SS-associated lipoprotein [Collimonas pratensis]|uniref:TssQ family T6SS-associated lipoprotein n=1 Tax=Collimonas pratensis TaxID=279113 RepID=UPI00143D1E8F|nr:TssQ family T6SS-associated lipoprotein [Collimonas pratensis]NKI70938.1 TssQ family T6SS-associated lipoprotein [Collimonas pratensis]